MKKATLRRNFERELLFNQEVCSVALIVSTGGFRHNPVFGNFCLHTPPIRSTRAT